MHIKTVENERLLVSCAWKLSPDCEDRYTDRETLERKAEEERIDKITCGICKKCAQLFDDL